MDTTFAKLTRRGDAWLFATAVITVIIGLLILKIGLALVAVPQTATADVVVAAAANGTVTGIYSVDGVQYHVTQSPYPGTPPVGGTVPIWYDPRDPNSTRWAPPSTGAAAAVMLLALVVGLSGPVVYKITKSFRSVQLFFGMVADAEALAEI